MKKTLYLLIAFSLFLGFVGCKNNDKVVIKNFLDDYYSYIGNVNDDNLQELAANEIDYNDKSVLKKYLDEKTIGILVADRDYLNPVYNKFGINDASVKIDSIEKQNDYYKVKYHLEFSGMSDLIEEHEISLIVDGDKIKIKNGNLGPTKNIWEQVEHK